MKLPIFGKFLRARALTKQAQTARDEKLDEIADSRQKAQDALEAFGKLKIDLYDGRLRKVVNGLERFRDVDSLPIELNNTPSVHLESPKEIQETDFEPVNGLKATILAGGVGAVTTSVSFAAVGTFASASTGAPIAALHGVAAMNATLAFLAGC